MSKKTGPEGELGEFPVDEFMMLLNHARKFMHSHPKEARATVAIALEVVAVQSSYATELRAPMASQPDFAGAGEVPSRCGRSVFAEVPRRNHWRFRCRRAA